MNKHYFNNIIDKLIIIIVLIVGLLIVPLRLTDYDLSSIPSGFGDNVFNNIILEHGFLWLCGKVSSFYNASFFVPPH